MCAVIRLGFPKRHVSPAAFVPEEAWRSFSEACFSFKQISISNSTVPTSKQTPESMKRTWLAVLNGTTVI